MISEEAKLSLAPLVPKVVKELAKSFDDNLYNVSAELLDPYFLEDNGILDPIIRELIKVADQRDDQEVNGLPLDFDNKIIEPMINLYAKCRDSLACSREVKTR